MPPLVYLDQKNVSKQQTIFVMPGARGLVRRPMPKALDEDEFRELIRLRSVKAAWATRSATNADAAWATKTDSAWATKTDSAWPAKAYTSWPAKTDSSGATATCRFRSKTTIPSIISEAAQAEADCKRRANGGARGIQACCRELRVRVGCCFGGGGA